jgi:hypothetical protein
MIEKRHQFEGSVSGIVASSSAGMGRAEAGRRLVADEALR